MNDNLLHVLTQTANGAALAICLFCAFLQLIHSEQVRSRKLLAGLMLLWAAFYMLVLVGTSLGQTTQSRGILSPFALLFGNFAAIVTTLYMVEVVRPGWLSLKRGVIWLAPFLLILALYYIGMAISGESSIALENMEAFKANLHLFNVWYRLVMLPVCMVYAIAMPFFFTHYAASYRRRMANYYSNNEMTDISWLWIYNFGLFCLTGIYIYFLSTGSKLGPLIHYCIVIVFFSYVNYKGLFHINPYPEGFFQHTMNEDKAEKEWELAEAYIQKQPFNTRRIEEYKADFELWMNKEKPYLRPDFKLTDVAMVLPVNRTYLSRLFNEGYSTSFNQLVRHYRIEEAKRLILENPQSIPKQLFEQCGFNSRAVFHRAFVEEMGITPKQWKEKVVI